MKVNTRHLTMDRLQQALPRLSKSDLITLHETATAIHVSWIRKSWIARNHVEQWAKLVDRCAREIRKRAKARRKP